MPDRIAGHYERHALAFDADRSRALFERNWLDRFLRLLPRGGHILDLGCGGGEPIARYMIDSGFRLTGVDIAPSLVKLARTRFGRQQWIEGDMRTVAFDPAAFDGVIAWHSLFHLGHDAQEAMFPRIASWLRPGGVLLFTSGPDRGECIGEYRGDPLYHASLAPHEYRALFAANGLAGIAHRADDPDCGNATIWLANKRV